jgi:hypothetical protein
MTLTLGGKWHGSYGSAPCPVCQPERRHDQCALSIRSEGDRLLTFCHKAACDFRSVLRAAKMPVATGGSIDLTAARETSERRATYDGEQLARARKLWNGARPIAGTKGETYLRGRGITCPLPASLRWAPDAFHGPTARWLSAMVADVSTGGVHRTFFEKTGQRIERNAKMMLGPCSGGAVALSEGPSRLVACEGLETGLSLLCGLLDAPATVWAALSTSNMRTLRLPEEPGELIVAADRDDSGAGMAAAEALAERAQGLGWKVGLWPAPEGKDWNDVLRLRCPNEGQRGWKEGC